MQIAISKAEEARRTLGSEPESALERAGLDLLVRPLAGRLRELYFGDCVVLSDRLTRSERRELGAHALGHHLLHAGNQWHQQGRTYTRGNYQERQADVFGAFFLVPEDKLLSALKLSAEPHALAQEFDLPQRFIEFRLRLHSARAEAAR